MLSCLLAGIRSNVQSIAVIVPLDLRGKGKGKNVFCKKNNARHSRWPRSIIPRLGMAFRRAWEVGERWEKDPVPKILKLPPIPDSCLEFCLGALSLQLSASQPRGCARRAYPKHLQLLQIPHVKPVRIQLPLHPRQSMLFQVRAIGSPP